MGTAISVCRNVLDAAFMDEEELSSALASQYGPQLLLRVDAAPIREASAAFLACLNFGGSGSFWPMRRPSFPKQECVFFFSGWLV